MLSDACRIAVEVGGMRMAWVGLVDGATGHVVVSARDGEAGDYLDGLKIVPADPVLGAGPTGTCIRTGRPVVSHDVAADPAMAPWRDRALAHGYRSSAALPLTVGGRTIGALSVYGGEADAVDEGLVVVLSALAIDIAASIERLALLDQLREARRQLATDLADQRRLTDELRQLDELRSSFLSGVSHELRTPLTAIVGFTDTLRDHIDELPAARVHGLLDRIGINVGRLEALIEDLLDLDRLGRGQVVAHRRPAPLRRLVDETMARVDVGGRRVHVTGADCTVPLDRPKVERILESLVTNAVHHTPPESTIWVRIEPQGGGALLVVEDDGPGVPDHLREAVLEPFTQGAHPVVRGVGIGLTLAAQYAAVHDGSVRVGEREGGGARVEVTLRPGPVTAR